MVGLDARRWTLGAALRDHYQTKQHGRDARDNRRPKRPGEW